MNLHNSKMSLRSTTTVEPAVDYALVYFAYANKIEKYFLFQSKGTLCCDSDVRQSVPSWYTRRTCIHSAIGCH